MAADSLTSEAAPATAAPSADPLRPLDRAKFMLVRAFLWGWARCFSLKGLYLLGQFFGTCEWLINPKRRRRFRKRFEETFGDAASQITMPVWRICWQHTTRTRCDKLFYLIFDKLPREKILKRIRLHNRDIFDEAVDQEKGVYVSMSHNGSHHVCVLLMALLGYKTAGVRDRNEGALRRYVQQKYEETFPEFKAIRMFYADTYPRDIYRCFREKFILGSALDVGRQRGAHLRRAKVTMFGQEREFLTGTLQIAMRCGAPVMQGFVVSRKNFYYHLIGKGPLVEYGTKEPEEVVLQKAMQAYADNIAAHLLEYPDHLSKV